MNGIDGGQGEAVRVPLTDGTLVKVPGSGHSDETVASLLTLSDVMCTGHHAAVSAEVKQGDTVAVFMSGRSVCHHCGETLMTGVVLTKGEKRWTPSWLPGRSVRSSNGLK